jgi:hypothetical protein
MTALSRKSAQKPAHLPSLCPAVIASASLCERAKQSSGLALVWIALSQGAQVRLAPHNDGQLHSRAIRGPSLMYFILPPKETLINLTLIAQDSPHFLLQAALF